MDRLCDGEVHVWYVSPEHAVTPELMIKYGALLTQKERERNRRFRFEAHRRRDLIARALVRTTLSRYADIPPEAWTFTTNPCGKPEIVNARVPPLRFSLSHSEGLVAIAVALRLDIGLDVERLAAREDNIAIARRFFSTPEADHLESVSRAECSRVFLEYWTLKEAYVKATGVGLSGSLDSFVIRLSTPPTISFLVGDIGATAEWHFTRLDLVPTHVAALAIRKAGLAPTVTARPIVPLCVLGTTSAIFEV